MNSRRFLILAYNNGEGAFNPREDRLTYLIEAKVDPYLSRNTKIDMKALKEDVLSAFLSRAKGVIGDSLLAKTTTVPLTETDSTTTHGEIADRYIEVSIVPNKKCIYLIRESC